MKTARIKKDFNNHRTTRRVISMKDVLDGTKDLILETIFENYKPEQFRPNESYHVEIPVAASDVRREYVLGNLCLDQDMVSEYDLFKKKETITEVILRDLEIQSITIVEKY